MRSVRAVLHAVVYHHWKCAWPPEQCALPLNSYIMPHTHGSFTLKYTFPVDFHWSYTEPKQQLN